MGLALSKVTIESQLTTRFGDVFKLNEHRFEETISTGIKEVDSFTHGLPRGAITEIFGPASSGRTSLMLSALAQATTHEEVCALIDTSNAFDPQSASQAGMDLEQLLWLRCDGQLEQAFKATDLILQGGGFGLVVLDLGDVPASQARKIISSWWYRFRRVVEHKPTALLVIAQDSCVRSCASLSLGVNKTEDHWSATRATSTRQEGVSQPHLKSDPAPTLLQGINLRAERQRPIFPGTREVCFKAQVS
ncbi:MAG: RecA domain protein [Acidobacteria bacterium]|nr:RecA domain protein [Acidobacteriota bacterium]